MASVRMVDAVGCNALGDVVRVRWGTVNTALNRWEGNGPRVADVIEVVDAIMAGSEVWTRMPSGAPGPKLRVALAKGGHGVETLAMDDPVRTVVDLEQL